MDERFGVLKQRTWGVFRDLCFSPDGKYVLASDSGGVTVLTASPLAAVLRAPGRDPAFAHFTPDSKQVVFVSSSKALRADDTNYMLLDSPPRVERWGVAERKHVASTLIPWHACPSAALSPDGGTLVCDGEDGALRVLNVATGMAIFELAKFAHVIWFTSTSYPAQMPYRPFSAGDPGSAEISFSPDGRCFLASPRFSYGSRMAWDLVRRRPIKLGGPLKWFGRNTSFIGTGAVMVSIPPLSDLYRPPPPRPGFSVYDYIPRFQAVVESRLFAFPSAKRIRTLELPPGPIHAATDPRYLINRPYGLDADKGDIDEGPAAAVEVSTGRVVFTSASALDVFGDHFVAEPAAGVVGLFDMRGGVLALAPIAASK